MTIYGYLLLAAGTLLWCLPFPIARRKQRASRTDKRARWGIALICVAYSLLWQGQFWNMPPATWRLAVSGLLFVFADILSWTSARALGQHLRLDAAVGTAHELIQSGPYGVVRHPIYASMLFVLVATGLPIAPAYLFIPALCVFLAGTLIRIRVEDRMLAEQFGQRFQAYRRAVPALVPFPMARSIG